MHSFIQILLFRFNFNFSFILISALVFIYLQLIILVLELKFISVIYECNISHFHLVFHPVFYFISDVLLLTKLF